MAALPQPLQQAWDYHRSGNLSQAEQLYRQILHSNSGDPQVWYLLGAVHQTQGKLSEAEAEYRQALQLKPDYAEVHHNLGALLAIQGKLDPAVASFRQALRINPDYPDALTGLGAALRSQRALTESETCLQQALRLRPDFANAHYNLGNTLSDLGRLDEAVPSFREAIRLQPNDPKAHNNLAGVLMDQGRIEEAVASYQQLLALKPDHARAHSNLLYALHYHPRYAPEDIFAAHLNWAKRHAEAVPTLPAPIADCNPERRLRIGYVSPDFRRHVVAAFIEPILSAHDREHFEITCYADVLQPDPVTERLQKKSERWRSLAGIGDEPAARLIRDDRIDILVDLAGHTAGNRLLVFARKPAPIQVTHFGYPDTTGLATMDYRITDAQSDPPGQTECFHTEKLVRLPEIAWCYQPPEAPPVSDLPVFRKGHVTFACLNNPAKVTAGTMALWSRILKAVPDSRIILLGGSTSQDHERHQSRWIENGIPPERVHLVEKKPLGAYLELYNSVDIALDPFPYNGGVTTCDALWMGVPVVTLAGSSYVSRQGVTLLNHLALPELIAATADEYIEIATRLAHDCTKLGALRGELRKRMEVSTLTNPQRFTRQLESAYRQIWSTWCANQMRSSF
jgi:predicted O-linked N-acetylglucosamine transferase (SPINDLY family)